MKFSTLNILFVLALVFAPRAVAQQRPAPGGEEPAAEGFALERRAETEARVSVSLCVGDGDVIVRGWDRNEVRVRAEGEGALRLLTPNVRPAPRVEVLVSDKREIEPGPGRCGSIQTVELTVPRGATVELQARTGHVEVSDVAQARIKVLSGDVDVRRVSRGVDVNCLSGDVSVSDSAGTVRVDTVSGDVEARNLRSAAAGDDFEVKSTSGDVTIEGVGHGNVTGFVTSGNLLYTGALVRGGSYDFSTISGDVTLELPADASFSLHAKVVVSGEIITDFPIKTAAVTSAGPTTAGPTSANSAADHHVRVNTDVKVNTDIQVNITPPPAPLPPAPGVGVPPAPPAQRRGPKVKLPREHESARLDGTVGSGDSVLNLSSFSGSLYLRKR